MKPGFLRDAERALREDVGLKTLLIAAGPKAWRVASNALAGRTAAVCIRQDCRLEEIEPLLANTIPIIMDTSPLPDMSPEAIEAIAMCAANRPYVVYYHIWSGRRMSWSIGDDND